jgi:outer membrane protein OmpA-like peptidoglycan-associated protein
MLQDFAKWIGPGVVTLLCGTAVCVAVAREDISNTLQLSSQSLLKSSSADWAEVSASGRNLILSGTATDEAQLNDVEQRLGNQPGVRQLVAQVNVAPLAAPFALTANVSGERISLSGAVPSAELQKALAANNNVSNLDVALHSGAPSPKAWEQGAHLILDLAQYLDTGSVTLSDLTITLTGRAKSERDYRDLLIHLRAGPPPGLQLATVDITAPLIEPYRWVAKFDGAKLHFSGHVPSDAVQQTMVAGLEQFPLSSGVTLGSGEPEDFVETAQNLLRQLTLLEYGEAVIFDGTSALSGAPRDAETAEQITHAFSQTSTEVSLLPARVDSFTISAKRQDNGNIIVSGFAPDEAALQALRGAAPNVSTDEVQLARGAPARFQAAAEFGLSLLAQMSAGEFTLTGTNLAISGTATDSETYAKIVRINTLVPQGVKVTTAAISPPVAPAYSLSLEKFSDAAPILARGFLPNTSAARTLFAGLDSLTNQTHFAAGAPEGFVENAALGLELLTFLERGSVSLANGAWSLSGHAKSADAKSELVAQVSAAGATDWTVDVTEPEIIPEPPYVFRLVRSPEGNLADGAVPSLELKAAFAAKFSAALEDKTKLRATAPDGFDAGVLEGVAAINLLAEGEVQFDGEAWSIKGLAPNADSFSELEAQLASATNAASWTNTVTVVPAPQAEVSQAVDPQIEQTTFVWSAAKSMTGAITIQGAVPSKATAHFLAARFGALLTDETIVVPDAPQNFAADMLVALDVVAALAEGEVSYDGTFWTIRGRVEHTSDAVAIAARTAEAETPADLWIEDLVGPAQMQPAPVSAETPSEAVDPSYAFAAEKTVEGAVLLSGQVPQEATLSFFAAITGGDPAALSVAPGAPEDFSPDAEIGLRALIALTEGQLEYASAHWSLKGSAADPMALNAVRAAISAVSDQTAWSIDIDVPLTQETPAVAFVKSAIPADISKCEGPVSDFSARNAILFQSGAAILSDQSQSALDELAVLLADCSDAKVYVEGHTDSDGDDNQNLALSVARAEAVIRALVDRGVERNRLYAIGYGEAHPVDDNATVQGRQANRRIVVSVKPERY